jgi:hypothetical protein
MQRKMLKASTTPAPSYFQIRNSPLQCIMLIK